jgi:hypothetical protein
MNYRDINFFFFVSLRRHDWWLENGQETDEDYTYNVNVQSLPFTRIEMLIIFLTSVPQSVAVIKRTEHSVSS